MTAEPRPPVLAVRNLGYSYPTRHVFNGWSADFGAGLHWVRGPNGSGKSTLLQLLGGVLVPSRGTLALREREASTDPIGYRREVYWCGSGPIAFDHLRAPEFFGFIRSLYPRFDVTALSEHIGGFGLAPHLDLPLSRLSTGTQRKVWLCAALVVNAAVVLIDEPINAIDAASQVHLQRVLLRCAGDRERAWIVTSHEPLGPAGVLARSLELAGMAAS